MGPNTKYKYSQIIEVASDFDRSNIYDDDDDDDDHDDDEDTPTFEHYIHRLQLIRIIDSV